jgi:predicted kinase
VTRRTATWTVGVPGSGKSTWADKNCPPDTLRLERDMFREAMWGGRQAYFSHTAEDQAKSFLLGSTIYNAMQTSLKQRIHENVLITDMGIHWNAVERFWDLAGRLGMHRRIVVFNVPWEVLEQRNRDRLPPDNRLPEAVLRKCFDAMWDEHAWWRAVKDITVIAEKGEPL